MADLDVAIQRLSFAEARSSSAEAMIEIARQRAAATVSKSEGKSDTETADELAEKTRELAAQHVIDKRA